MKANRNRGDINMGKILAGKTTEIQPGKMVKVT